MANNVDIGFASNYQYANLLNITPTAEKATWAFLGQGIDDISSEREEKIDEREDYSTGGNTETIVKGVTKTTSVSGIRVFGNEVQDWLASIEECFDGERDTQYRIVSPTGEIIEEKVTIRDVVMSGPNGAASDKQAISFSMARNDTPEIIEPTKGMHLPSTVTLEAVTVAVGASATVEPKVTPETASPWCLYAIENTDIAHVSGDGIVTGLKAGKTRLSARCSAKPSVRVTVDVEVTGDATE